MKKNVKRILFVSCIISILIFLLFSYLYNNVWVPFKGENKDILFYPTDSPIYEEDKFKEFYYDFLEYENYEEKYDTKFYYCFGYKALIPQYTVVFDKFAFEAYSYVIKCEGNYNRLKEEILSEYKFVETPVRLSYESDVIMLKTFFDINGTIYQEIHYDYFIEDWEYRDPNRFRIDSYWFGYNDERKEIIFSYLSKDSSADELEQNDALFLLENNLYS